MRSLPPFVLRSTFCHANNFYNAGNECHRHHGHMLVFPKRQQKDFLATAHCCRDQRQCAGRQMFLFCFLSKNNVLLSFVIDIPHDNVYRPDECAGYCAADANSRRPIQTAKQELKVEPKVSRPPCQKCWLTLSRSTQ